MEIFRYSHMKIKWFFIFSFCLIKTQAQNIAQNQLRGIEAPVNEVTVFVNQAQVTRATKTWVSEGISTLRFDNISPYLIEQSLQVYADERLQLLSVKKINNYLNEEEKPKEIILLEDSLKHINKLLTIRKQAKEVLIFEKDVLTANKQIGGSQTGLKADELEDILIIFRKRLSDIDADWLIHTEEENKLNAVKNILSKQLAEYNNGINNLTSAIEITIKSDQQINNAIFELRYVVTNAQWKPYYDIRVTDAGLPVTFILKAHVVQQTGEDWKNIKLKLSTANPSISAIKPILNTQYLRFIFPDQVQDVMRKKSLNRNLKQQAEPTMVEDANAGNTPMFETQENLVSTEFVAANLYHIPSNSQGARVELLNLSAKSDFSYATTPKLDKSVFTTAQFAGLEIIRQLPAEAEIFYQGTYTGKTFIAQTVNDTINISLGSDKRILTERKKIKDLTEKSFLGSTKTVTNGYEITVKNNKKEKIAILVEDQIPLSTDKDIEVKLLSNPDNGMFNPTDGKLIWNLRLDPGQAETVKFMFEVKHPKNKMINGF